MHVYINYPVMVRHLVIIQTHGYTQVGFSCKPQANQTRPTVRVQNGLAVVVQGLQTESGRLQPGTGQW